MFTPHTQHIRRAYVFDQVCEAKTLGFYEENVTEARAKEGFDLWLKNTKSETFDEGIRLAVGNLPPHTTTAIFNANPYKE